MTDGAPPAHVRPLPTLPEAIDALHAVDAAVADAPPGHNPLACHSLAEAVDTVFTAAMATDDCLTSRVGAVAALLQDLAMDPDEDSRWELAGLMEVNLIEALEHIAEPVRHRHRHHGR